MRLSRLDGIRALAISLVLAHHTLGFDQGWFGVDVFFVLSGFLITGILRRDRNNKSFWAPFYIKRATRIIPPLILAFIGASFVYTIAWRGVGLMYVFFAANIAEAMHPAKGNPLGVLWSLAIEEHFYLVWPFAIRYLRRDQLLRLLAIILIAGPLVRGLLTPFLNSYLPVYYLTPLRLDGLAAGSLLAILLEDETSTAWLRAWSGYLSLGLVLLLAAMFTQPFFQREANSWSFNSLGYSLIAACCFFFLAFVYLHEDSKVSALLSLSPVAFIGMISYGLYLFSPTVMVEMDRVGAALGYPHRHRLAPITFALSILVSWLSYTFYEKPIMKWGHSKAHELNPKRLPQMTSVNPA